MFFDFFSPLINYYFCKYLKAANTVKKKFKIMGVILVIFCIYMAFFDQNNWLLQRERIKNLESTNERIEYLNKESDRMEAELNGLKNNPEIIERNAREKYFHKKDGEDVYLIKSQVDSTLEINATEKVKE